MEYLLSAGIDIGTTTTHLVISRYGMAPVEAGAYIADVIQDLLQKGGK